jgi:HEAT repeat protein
MGVRVSNAEIAQALTEVMELRKQGDVAGLIGALTDPRERGAASVVRAAAARGLGELGDTAAAPHLIPLVHDPLDNVRLEAIYALGSLGAREAIPALVEALSDESQVVRLAAVKSLGESHAESAVEKLQDGLNSADPWQRLYCAEALLKIGGEAANPALIESAYAKERGWRKGGRGKRWKRVREQLGQ